MGSAYNASDFDLTTFKNNVQPSKLTLNSYFRGNSLELFAAANDTIYNNGFAKNGTIWPTQDLFLGYVKQGNVLKFETEYDPENGIVAIDNIRLFTNQK